MQHQIEATDGLDEVVAATTKLSSVDGQAGELIIAGCRLEQLADRPFEEVVERLWRAAGVTLERPRTRALPPRTVDLLAAAANEHADPMDALRMGIGSLLSRNDAADALTLVGSCPTLAAAYYRLLRGLEPVTPRQEFGLAENYLYMLTGTEPDAARVQALDTYLTTVCDHGFNASTFTARVIVSTGADFVSAATGAVGALKGPLHGGAPGPALDTVFEIERKERAEPCLRAKLDKGERLMGFGHRIYKVRDPRASVLNAAAARLFESSSDSSIYELARYVESTALQLLEEYKPDRHLKTNVEFFTALLLHGLGIETTFFTPTFAVGRVAGWTAHCFEQRAVGRLIRPQSRYVGERPAGSEGARVRSA